MMHRPLHWTLETIRPAAGIRAIVLILISALSLPSCVAQKSNGKPSYYHEDLYFLRPRFEEPVDTLEQVLHRPKEMIVPTMMVNTKVDNVLDSINSFNITRKFIDGYTIQIYSGQNREEAMNTKKKLAAEPNLNGLLEYNQPKFRVRVGNYYSRLESQRDLIRLKRLFPNAILVPEKILVR